MENNNHKKRKVMLIAAFAVAVIALAGIGYATVTGYKATTVNSQNDATGVYFTATQTSGNYVEAFNASDVIINTYTDAGITTPIYTIPDSAEITRVDETTYTGVQIGAPTGLTINLDGATTANYNVSVKVQKEGGGLGLSGTTGGTTVWTYILQIKDQYIILNASGEGSATITEVGTAGQAQTVNAKLYIASTKVFGEFGALVTPTEGYSGFATANVSPAPSPNYKILDNVMVAFTFTTAA